MTLSAVILAGGKSSRMGRDKAFLEFEGRTLLERQIILAREIGAKEIFIAGRPDANYAGFDCLILNDKFQNAGPLAGIERALDSASTTHLLVLAVDLPGLHLNFLRRLLSACRENLGAIPRIASQIEPLAAVYSATAKPLAEKLLQDRNHRVTSFAEQCAESNLAQFVSCNENERELFANWNSPEDVPMPINRIKA
jgi:molybdopterin-guanine dinucleotide biosynthesis protein A